MATVLKAHLLQWSPNRALFPRDYNLSPPLTTTTPVSGTSVSLSLSVLVPKYTTSKGQHEPDMVAHNCYPSICQVEAEGSGTQGQPGPYEMQKGQHTSTVSPSPNKVTAMTPA